ncbi:hypothetical protein ASC77_25315 [Nocardioides sp. Root1257]|uniref:hypothetical protein n=1 Tax=unclassified Nocardioides TaxID=2615069 RepID=UPI0006F4B1F8|nr:MULTISPECIES: hypothetical protein [unclassified Nocardioides]KQW50976.1 hypothetical protein ASC77_25315 [Nocardioides sp. Root1257]KRC53772.1 hypothetical protein ASE24_25105 [Nocardioides sp. Root224]
MSAGRLSARLGVAGAALGMTAGTAQVVIGPRIPAWTGDKLANGPLGLLTVALSALAGLAALRQRDPNLSVQGRTACALAMIGPGLLCLTTVGRLWYLPAALLLPAGLLTVHSWRGAAAALGRDCNRGLLTALGASEMMMVANGPGRLMLVGGLGGAALLVATWWRSAPRRWTAALVVLGTVPFAVMAWTVVLPVLLAALSWSLVIPVARQSRHEPTTRAIDAVDADDSDPTTRPSRPSTSLPYAQGEVR